MDWFLYDNGLRHERVKFKDYFWLNLQLYYKWALSVRYSIQNRRKTKNSAGVKILILSTAKFSQKKLWIFTHFFFFFAFSKNGWAKGHRCCPRIFLRYSGYLFCRSYLGYCFHNRKGDLVRLLIISWTRRKGLLENRCSVSFDVQSFSKKQCYKSTET